MSNMKPTARFVITPDNKVVAEAVEHFVKELAMAAAQNRPADTFWNLAMAYRFLERFSFFVPDAVYERRFGAAAMRQRRFYNIGGGKIWFHPFWTVLDAELISPNAGIQLDLRRRETWPIENGTAKLVYSSHMLDFLDDDGVAHLLNEAYRILEPGGLIRIAVPDIDLLHRAYLRGEIEFFNNVIDSPPQYQGLSLGQNFISRFVYSCSALSGETADFHISDAEVDDLFQRLPHEAALDACVARLPPDAQSKINWFNEAKLARLLTDAGFAPPRRSACGQSEELVLCDLACFDYTAVESTLYMETRKPGLG